MENKAFYLSFLCLLPGLSLSGFLPLNDAIKNIGWEVLLSNWILVPTFLIIAITVLRNISIVGSYTDEFMPFKLGLISLILALVGIWFSPRLLILGIIGIILAAYWCRGTVYQYD